MERSSEVSKQLAFEQRTEGSKGMNCAHTGQLRGRTPEREYKLQACRLQLGLMWNRKKVMLLKDLAQEGV